jgi:hypothetical protein
MISLQPDFTGTKFPILVNAGSVAQPWLVRQE